MTVGTSILSLGSAELCPRVPREELLLRATCYKHLSERMAVCIVCISGPSRLVSRVESSVVEQRDSPKGFLS